MRLLRLRSKKSHGFHEVDEIQGKVTLVGCLVVSSRNLVGRMAVAVETGFNGHKRLHWSQVGKTKKNKKNCKFLEVATNPNLDVVSSKCIFDVFMSM